MKNLCHISVRARQAFNRAAVLARHWPRRMRSATLADYLFGARSKLGLTQAELAKRSGMSQQQIQKLESGKVDARLGTWRRVFGALHCDLLVIPRPRRHLGEARARRVLDGAE